MKKKAQKKRVVLRKVKFPIGDHIRAILLGFVDEHCEGNVVSAKAHLQSGSDKERSRSPFANPTFESPMKEKIRVVALISDNEVIALSGFSMKGKFATNSWTVVRKTNRQKGVGSYLLKVKLALAKSEGVKVFNTTTAVANLSSRKMLEKTNFHEIELYEGHKREMVRFVDFLEGHNLSEFDETIKEIKCLEYRLE